MSRGIDLRNTLYLILGWHGCKLSFSCKGKRSAMPPNQMVRLEPETYIVPTVSVSQCLWFSCRPDQCVPDAAKQKRPAPWVECMLSMHASCNQYVSACGPCMHACTEPWKHCRMSRCIHALLPVSGMAVASAVGMAPWLNLVSFCHISLSHFPAKPSFLDGALILFFTLLSLVRRQNSLWPLSIWPSLLLHPCNSTSWGQASGYFCVRFANCLSVCLSDCPWGVLT